MCLVRAQSRHTSLSVGVKTRERAGPTRRPPRKTVTEPGALPLKPNNPGSLNLVCIIDTNVISPHFHPAGSPSQPDHTTQTSAAGTRAFTAPRRERYGRADPKSGRAFGITQLVGPQETGHGPGLASEPVLKSAGAEVFASTHPSPISS